MSANASPGTGRLRAVTADEVGRSSLALAFEACQAEREALARRLDLLSLEALTAHLRFELADDEAEGAIRVTGTIRARLVQSCVVTLEPVPRTLSEAISVLYTLPTAEQPEHEIEVLAEGDEAEPLPEDGIDAGTLVAEHLALFLDPYPRHPDAPGAPLTYSAGDDRPKLDASGDDRDTGPFAALGQLKSKL